MDETNFTMSENKWISYETVFYFFNTTSYDITMMRHRDRLMSSYSSYDALMIKR